MERELAIFPEQLLVPCLGILYFMQFGEFAAVRVWIRVVQVSTAFLNYRAAGIHADILCHHAADIYAGLPCLRVVDFFNERFSSVLAYLRRAEIF